MLSFVKINMPKFKEKAFLLNKESDKLVFSGVNYIYTGDEFCQRLLPGIKTISRLAGQCIENKVGLTLVTSYLTGDGVDNLKFLLNYIISENIDCELVINDWGVVELLRDYPGRFRVIAGRLLTSRYLNKFHYQPEGVKKDREICDDFYYLFPQDFLDFLKNSGISSLEFNHSNHLAKTYRQIQENGLKAHLYYPYYYLNTSRYCSCAGEYVSYLQNTDKSCKRECDSSIAVRKDRHLHADILSRGNTLFLRENKKIEDLGLEADRVIYNDFILKG